MSNNLVKKSGMPVMVYDQVTQAVEEAEAAGAKRAGSIDELARECDFIFTMLPKDEHVESVCGQMLTYAHAGQIYTDMSTILPDTSWAVAAKIRETGASMLDALVAKSRPAAIEGALGIYVGGDKASYEAVLPLLKCMGNAVVHLGENGAGSTMKLCHNMLVAQIQNGVNEMLCAAKVLAGITIKRINAFPADKNLHGQSEYPFSGQVYALWKQR